MFRYLAFRTLRQAENALEVVNLVGSELDVVLFRYHSTYACVSGLGFGATSAATAMLNVLADVADGPGTLGFFGDHNSMDYVFFSAMASSFSVLHTLWSVIASRALILRQNCVFLFVPAAHLFTSSMTMLSQQAHVDVRYKVIPFVSVGVVLYLTAVTAFIVSGGTPKNLLTCLRNLRRGTSVPSNVPERIVFHPEPL
ncbi:gamma-secretase subunit Aph-1-like [Rhipicephalus microplus]|uniref:gamma-secretase subunit Aph-1-like n=1 Tax=Rhipicephalus microplus TaxID=6941 RepID=UPI003F6DA51E